MNRDARTGHALLMRTQCSGGGVASGHSTCTARLSTYLQPLIRLQYFTETWRTTMFMGLRQIAHPRPCSSVCVTHDTQKRWCPRGLAWDNLSKRNSASKAEVLSSPHIPVLHFPLPGLHFLCCTCIFQSRIFHPKLQHHSFLCRMRPLQILKQSLHARKTKPKKARRRASNHPAKVCGPPRVDLLNSHDCEY